ncbi:hypothetical protein [Bradyrhizobium sp. CCBAU 53421]|uniref:hypothetical protein n=1 Tax=Bradyrhizobium sp. CCBAU 53421 TaxID=1325120 RepID=UPI00188A18EA|nr:hypothetical protein [Bradyrhizobium sp. CCBAU 53421]
MNVPRIVSASAAWTNALPRAGRAQNPAGKWRLDHRPFLPGILAAVVYLIRTQTRVTIASAMIIEVTIMPYGRACLACVVSAMLGGADSAGPSLTTLVSCAEKLYPDAADAGWFL